MSREGIPTAIDAIAKYHWSPAVKGEPYMLQITKMAGAPIVEVAYPPLHRFAYHCDAQSRISVVLNGSLLEATQGREVHATAASVVVKPTDVRHRNEFGKAGARVLSILSPSALLDGYHTGTTEGLERWSWHHSGPIVAAALQLVRAIRWTPGDIQDGLWDLIGELIIANNEQECADPPRWLLQTKERLDEEFVQKPSVKALAADAGVHPVYLARAFRRCFGCSVTTYRRRLRVRAAAARLASTHTPTAQVALMTGFADQSHMCRDFRTELRISPGRLRDLLGNP